MEDTFRLRQAVLTWLEQARNLPSVPQAITDVALAVLPEWEALSNAVVRAAPLSDHRDLYGKVDGDWLPRWSTLLGGFARPNERPSRRGTPGGHFPPATTTARQ
ncbi:MULTISPECIES: hypothetical protein [unclassified Streptomyces]|uniref:hypothetical protein n=1 Tax=unclassified Streptomyces TaxID=2593676 RepID=UPI001163CC4C|nr:MULTISPECIES: hypothetical protein [unclassified Streptomyces]NMI54229.1 hypothetical protein [Streptomyces sp. RLA2-12]QDN63172.1 hypothetical protein FNV67_55800 [Streptomyces sp. S1D4-20]QDN73224.1 hypothetical protein FNV66_54680 [Streptomyces sp. S1D4-14]QDO55822.1 hypothetical protein FNV60_54095 [Streptomyces sp. RLB3-5]QDO56908.1 hypothetical protein FNV59_00075 [Streptomyces sp. RLB1-8]